MVTLIYWDCYACLRFVAEIVMHGYAWLLEGYAWLHEFTGIVTHGYPDCYAWLRLDTRGRNQMVTHGYTWLRMGQFADGAAANPKPCSSSTF